ncbi:peptide ABC transporter substrate-binding protein [Thermosediminibacter litoriperuensis]|uniref:Oligopeptide transport system substrate-binding protein n=1 Tax=Thermosediminibacter litoriperuensis TaxID=291989 RepID=A0A5S5AXG2_9FIRM|nr:peptide ABC transporter substrate-binding protein [Thermosediminibacter litoriperuensis]TYP58557.1 oligopeptide transport system substrate-binding protein [Thermosediminibacter litoriperuensis]
MLKKLTAILLSMLIVAGILTGCSNTATKSSKELVFSIPSEPPTLDPQLATDQYSIIVGNAVFEGLVRYYDGKVYPGMAERWDVSEDKKVYTFHLRDAKWSDGSKVTAYDFEYSIKRLLDPKLASGYANQGYYILNGEEYNLGKINDPNQVGVKALDEKTLQITLKSPTKYIESLLGFISFLPSKKELVEKYAEKYAADADKMVYNGPFIIKEWKHEQEIVLVKNPNYWAKDKIKLEKVRILIITDPNTAYQMFENDELDFADVPTPLVEKVKSEGNALTYMDSFEYFIRFNMKKEGKPYLANENFRKAIGFAIDREDYINMAFKGVSKPATRYIPPTLSGLEKKFAEEFPYEFYTKKADVAKAKELLNKAMQELGITDPSQINIEITVDDSSGTKEGIEAIQDMLVKNLGINVNIKIVTFKERLQRMRSGDYEVMITRWGPDYDDPMTYLDYWTMSEGMINSGWTDEKYNELCNAAKNTSDFAKRNEILFEAEKYLLEKGAVVPLYFREKVWVKKDYVKDLVRTFSSGSDPDFIYASIEGGK